MRISTNILRRSQCIQSHIQCGIVTTILRIGGRMDENRLTQKIYEYIVVNHEVGRKVKRDTEEVRIIEEVIDNFSIWSSGAESTTSKNVWENFLRVGPEYYFPGRERRDAID